MPPEKQHNNLTSWKQIAEFLGVSERTAQVWEEERGLPVRRLTGSKGRVSAQTADLERWMKANTKPAPWYGNLKVLRYYSVVATALALLAFGVLLGIYLMANRHGPPANYRLDFNNLAVSDADGREIWRYPFPYPFKRNVYLEEEHNINRRFWCDTLYDGDRRKFIIFNYYSTNVAKSGTTLYCFSQSRDVLWSWSPGRAVSDLKRSYSSLYSTTDFHVCGLEPGGPKRILVTSHHISAAPNQFAILGASGTVLKEYWHSGQFDCMEVEDPDGDGIPDIYLAGLNNGYGCATVVVLDPRQVDGASDQPSGDTNQLQGFKSGTEKAIILFPHSCVNRAHKESGFVRRLDVMKTSIEADIWEIGSDGNASVKYIFDINLQLKQVIYSDWLKVLHNQMYQKGELDHAYSDADEADLFRQVKVIWKDARVSK